jgi:uncharacterized protein DUF6941
MSAVAVDAFLADAVTVVDGKLYALGAGWNRIVVRSLPARHDRIGIGLLFHLDATAAGPHRFAIRLETPSGTPLQLGSGPAGPVSAIEGGFTAGGDDVTMPFAMQLDGLPLEAAGRYAIHVAVDGEDLKALAFHVTLQTQAPAESGPSTTGTAGYL